MSKDPRFFCKDGQRHQFAGGKCIRPGCGATQGGKEPKQPDKGYELPKQKRGIHSPAQEFCNWLCEQFNEPKSFGMFMGVISNYQKALGEFEGIDHLRSIAKDVLEREDITNPGKYFMGIIRRDYPKIK